jgi:tetratricopeptide (TPR) repeat protein
VTWSPFLLYYPVDGMRGAPKAFGQGDTGHGFFRTHQSLFMTGSLYAYAAMTAVEAEIVKNARQSNQLAGLALEAMDVCRRRGIRPTASLALRGRFLFARDDFAGAYVSLQKAITEMETHGLRDAENHLFAGLAALRIDLPESALRYLTAAVELDPTRAEAWNGLGAARDLVGDPTGARIAFDQSIALEPESSLTWYNRGLLNFNCGDLEGSRNDLQVALSLDPELERAERLLRTVEGGDAGTTADIGFQYGDTEAVDIIARGGESLPRSQRDMSGLEEGLIAVQSGQPPRTRSTSRAYTEEEVENLASAYRDDPSRANRRALAEGLIRVGRPDDARDLMLPFWSDAAAVDEHTLMLEADRALGDTQRARQLAASLAGAPPTQGNATLWALVAFICLDAGLKDEGMAALDAAISLDPENTALKRHRSLLSSG